MTTSPEVEKFLRRFQMEFGRPVRLVEDTFIDVGALLGDHTLGRGLGHTTDQMRKAPRDAIFIWCNDKLDYPTRLARFLGREDLDIERPGLLKEPLRYGHRRQRGPVEVLVVVDHGFFTPKARYLLNPVTTYP